MKVHTLSLSPYTRTEILGTGHRSLYDENQQRRKEALATRPFSLMTGGGGGGGCNLNNHGMHYVL